MSRDRGDGVHIDPPHAIAQRHIVADLVERVGTLDRDQRRRLQGLIDERLGRHRGVDDILVLRDADDGYRQVEEDRLIARAAVVDEDELATVALAAEAADEAAIVVRHGDDLIAVRPIDDRIVPVAAPFAPPLPELEETLVLVMAYEGLPALADDLPVVGFLDDDPAARFSVLMPLGAQILDVGEARGAGLGWLSGLRRLSGLRDDTLEGLLGLGLSGLLDDRGLALDLEILLRLRLLLELRLPCGRLLNDRGLALGLGLLLRLCLLLELRLPCGRLLNDRGLALDLGLLLRLCLLLELRLP